MIAVEVITVEAIAVEAINNLDTSHYNCSF